MKPEMKTIFTNELIAGMKFELGGQDYEVIKVEVIKNDFDESFHYVTFVLFMSEPAKENLLIMNHGLMFDVYK